MRASVFAVVSAFALVGTGCEKLFQKDADRTLEAGDKKMAAGDMRMAIKFYEAALDGTARTADVHFKLAMIYDDKLHEPVSALHHFDRYLELAPDGAHAKEAKAHQKEASLRLADSLKGGAFLTQADAARISKENLRLQMEIVKLKAQKAAPAPVTTGKKSEPVLKPIPAGARTYTVQKGDTLASIAAKFYKNKGSWPKIRDANFEEPKGTPPIHAGQVLRIP
ncbi:MAG: LysM domain-containing protein [Chthoniobacteraceae bacterium]